MTEAILHDDPASINIVGKIVAQRRGVGKRAITERNNNIVLLQLPKGRSRGNSVEKISSSHA